MPPAPSRRHVTGRTGSAVPRGRLAAVVTACLCALVLAAVAAPAAQAGCGFLGLSACPKPPPLPPAPDPGGQESPNQPVPPPAGKFFGIGSGFFINQDGQAPVDSEVNRLWQGGAQLERFSVSWNGLQPTNAPLNWDQYPRGQVPYESTLNQLDLDYNTLQAKGMRPLMVIGQAPVWATKYASCQSFFGMWSSDCQPVASHSNLFPDSAHYPAYANFVAALGKRYPNAVIEAWNEPNWPPNQPYMPTPAQMAGAQCAMYQAIKALPAPRPLVLSASMGGASNVEQYMGDFYAAGGYHCFDALAVHTYSGSNQSLGANSPLARWMDIFRRVRAKYGDTTPIWVTEYGYTTSGSAEVTPAQQADLLRRIYNRFMTMPDVQAAVVHMLRDAPLTVGPQSDPNDSQYGYGMFYRTWAPKPSWCDLLARVGRASC